MRTIVIGLDGASFNLIGPWIEEGRLPNIKKLFHNGVHADLESCLPPVTSPNWKCYSTGMNPGKLGIFWWENIDLKLQRVYFPRERVNNQKEIWDYLGENGYRVGIINTPLNYPPKKIKGFMVSGGPDAGESGFTYPKDVESLLKKELNYAVNSRWLNHMKTDEHKTISEIYGLIQSRFDAAKLLVEEFQPDFLHITIFYINTLHHFFWNNDYVEKGWQIIDENIGKLLDANTNLILMSDHGTNPIEQVFYVNSWLEKEGYLKLKRMYSTQLLHSLGITRENMWRLAQNLKVLPLIKKVVPKRVTSALPTDVGTIEKEGKTSVIDWKKSAAIASGQGPVYVKVENDRKKDLVNEIFLKLKALINPETGLKIASNVYKKNEIYSGQYLYEAPDLIIDQAKGTHIRGGVAYGEIFESTSGWRAENRRHGIFVAQGPNVFKKEPESVSILDLAPSILSIYGISKPEEMEGRVLDCIKNIPAKRDTEIERIRRTIRRKRL
jgi:predicted AlkP superfamily phosphohydrolase/phosphomutase